MKFLADPGDKEFVLDREMYIVWALGRLDSNNEPSFHDYYPRSSIKINFNTSEPENDCFNFLEVEPPMPEIWQKSHILDRSIRSFTATLGPAGGKKGYTGLTGNV